MLRRYIVVKWNRDSVCISPTLLDQYGIAMPTKLDPKKLRREMVDFERGQLDRINFIVGRKRYEAFSKAIAPASASEMLDYLMECVIRGSKSPKGKK